MRNEICKHCKYKRAFCWLFRCDPYYEAQLKRTERRFYKNFMEDYNAEDRYVASLIVAVGVFGAILLFMIMRTFKTIGEMF